MCEGEDGGDCLLGDEALVSFCILCCVLIVCTSLFLVDD